MAVHPASEFRKCLEIPTESGAILIVDEKHYLLGSIENLCHYPYRCDLSSKSIPVSAHGVYFNNEPIAVFAGGAGATGVHTHSALALNGRLYLAVSDHVVCLQVSPFEVYWTLKVDYATCFGVHYQATKQALISHGEVEVSRFTEDGLILWRMGGADIFTGHLTLRPDSIHVVDLEDRAYQLSYEDGSAVQ